MEGKELIYLPENIDLHTAIDAILEDEELSGCGLDVDKIQQTIYSFEGDILAASVFLKKYAIRNNDNQIVENTLEECLDRVANCIAHQDKQFPDPRPIEDFRELYNYFLPGGRQLFGLGNKYLDNVSYSNCYTTSIEDDNMESIFGATFKIAKTFSFGGGQGIDLSKLRPKGSRVSNSAKFSTGAVSFAPLYSFTTGLIGQHGRRGALMVMLDISHPDIEDFIELKHDNKEAVKYANLSVKTSDEFMAAVESDIDFGLQFATKHETIEKTLPARYLWNKLIKAARDSAEPGVLFWDTIVQESPSDSYERLQIVGTNPCGELPLEDNGSCCIGSLLLHKFVDNPFTPEAKFNYSRFDWAIELAVRHLDNVVELNLSRHPLPEQAEAARSGRRIGLGLTGLADCLAALGLVYDSTEAIEAVREIMQAKMITEYFATCDLAAERGAFPLFDAERHYSRGFCSRLPESIIQQGHNFGQRNVSISTVAPSGSLSILGRCSSGIEPIFARSYERFVNLGADRKQFHVVHPGLIRSGNKTELFPAAHEIDPYFRVKLQGVIQHYVDSAISSTINLPEDVTEETVNELYLLAWKEGLKGLTIYRENSREGILLTHLEENEKPNLDSKCFKFTAEGGDKFYVHVSYTDGDLNRPYQVFTSNYKATEHDRFIKLSNEVKKLLLDSGAPEGILKAGESISSKLDQQTLRSKNTLDKLNRFMSLALKCGYLDPLLDILYEHAFLGTLAYHLFDILGGNTRKPLVCGSCGSSNIRKESGCKVCLDCGASGCG